MVAKTQDSRSCNGHGQLDYGPSAMGQTPAKISSFKPEFDWKERMDWIFNKIKKKKKKCNSHCGPHLMCIPPPRKTSAAVNGVEKHLKCPNYYYYITVSIG